MRRKNLMTALICAFCLAAAPMSAMAEETEAVTEAVTEASEETEAVTEAAEEETAAESETEAEAAPVERPDYQALDYVTLGEYKGLTVVPEPTTAADEEVDARVRSNIQIAGLLEETTEGVVQEGDTAVIDYEGKLDGVAFDGGTAKDQELVIGSNTFIEGFEEGLIGVAVGETVDLPLTFPENYFSADLAGQEVIFTVTVNAIKTVPELTDELVNTLTEGEYTEVEAYRESVRQTIEAEKESMYDSQIRSDLLTQVANVSVINEYPQVMIDYGVDNMVSYYKEQAEMYSMEYADFLSTFLGLTEEQFDEQVVLAVEQSLQMELYLKAIAETEGIEVSEEEYAESSAAYAADYGYENVEEFEADYGESVIRISILQEKVLDFLVENAVIEVETESESGAETEAAETELTEADSEAGDETELTETESETEAETETAETESGTEAETEAE